VVLGRKAGSVVLLVAAAHLVTKVVLGQTVACSHRNETHANYEGVDLGREHVGAALLGSRS